ncbi:MAG: hypothetical protein WCP45_05275 [Verrucomicrobiota bacterium]
MNKKTKSQPPEFAVNMSSAEHLFGVPKFVQVLAKSRGCPAFVFQRVHRRPLLAWVKRNARFVAEVTAQREAAAADRGEWDRLKCRKLELETEALGIKLQADKGLTMLKTEAEELWSHCAAIVMEEAKTLMDREQYRDFIAAIKGRYAQLQALGEAQHGPLPPPASSLS